MAVVVSVANESCCLQTHFMDFVSSSVTIKSSHYVAPAAPMNHFLSTPPLPKKGTMLLKKTLHHS